MPSHAFQQSLKLENYEEKSRTFGRIEFYNIICQMYSSDGYVCDDL